MSIYCASRYKGGIVDGMAKSASGTVPFFMNIPEEARARYKSNAANQRMTYADYLEHLMDRADRLNRLEMDMPALVVQP